MSGYTQWQISLIDHESPKNNNWLEIVIGLSAAYRDRDVLVVLTQHLEHADYDWITVHDGRIQLDAELARSSIDALCHTPWFTGLFEVEPLVDTNEKTVVRIRLTEKEAKLLQLKAGISFDKQLAFYRRLVSWTPILLATVWSIASLIIDLRETFEFQLFPPSGALLTATAAWLEVWIWLWRQDSSKQLFHGRELQFTTVIGFVFLVFGTIIWAYGGLLVG